MVHRHLQPCCRITASAIVGIADTHDVILAEIGTHLHFNDDDRRACVIAESMMSAKRDIDRLSGFECQCFAAQLYRCNTINNDPMFIPLVVVLQG